MGYSSRYWMTYRQAEALGGQVRKGETSSLSVYYSQISKTEQDRGDRGRSHPCHPLSQGLQRVQCRSDRRSARPLLSGAGAA